MKPPSWPIWIRISLTAVLAVTGPAMAIAAATSPGGRVAVRACPHPREDASDPDSPADDPRDHPTGECLSPCCLPAGVLGTLPLDAAVLLGVPSPTVVAEDGTREVLHRSHRRLSPFAIGPPAAL